MSFVFANFNDSIFEWDFYYYKSNEENISFVFNLKEDVTITEWKNNIFNDVIKIKSFSKNQIISINVTYKVSIFDTSTTKPIVDSFVKNKVWYDNDGNKHLISNSSNVLLPFINLDFKVGNQIYAISGNKLSITPYTMFWDFIEKDPTIFTRPSNAIDLDENSFGLPPPEISTGNSYNLDAKFPFDNPDIQYNKLDNRIALERMKEGLDKFPYKIEYETLLQLRFFTQQNFNGIFSHEDTYKINNPNKLIYETQIKLDTNRTQGLFLKIYPDLMKMRYEFKKNDIVKIRLERNNGSVIDDIANPSFYYLGYDWNVLSNPKNYDGTWIKSYLSEKRFPLIDVFKNRKKVTLSSQIYLGTVSLFVDVIRDNKLINVVSKREFEFRNVWLSFPYSMNYYVEKIDI